jgi:hypothetical protein
MSCREGVFSETQRALRHQKSQGLTAPALENTKLLLLASLQSALYRLQNLVWAVENAGARVPYLVDHLLGRAVALNG